MTDIGISTLGSSPVDTGFQSEALANLDKDTFLQLLVAQMQYQNPLSPVDSQQYLAQAAQYASVEQLENMAESQAELKSMQMVSIATDLVGKNVTAYDTFTGGEITGKVEAVRFGTEPNASESMILAIPKSRSLTSPSGLTRTFSGLRSL